MAGYSHTQREVVFLWFFLQRRKKKNQNPKIPPFYFYLAKISVFTRVKVSQLSVTVVNVRERVRERSQNEKKRKYILTHPDIPIDKFLILQRFQISIRQVKFDKFCEKLSNLTIN